MLNVFILCKQTNTSIDLLNTVVNRITDLKLIGISGNLRKAKSIMQDIEPDLIISDNKKIINLIKVHFTTYTPGIVLLSDNLNIKSDYKNLLLINSETDSTEKCFKILEFVKSTIECSYKEKLIKTLMKLKFNFNLAGTIYILDSILYVHSYKGAYSFERMKRDIYSHVAKIHNSNIDRVNWSISRSINYMYKNHTKDSYYIIEEFFGTKYPEKPTPKLVISLIATKVD